MPLRLALLAAISALVLLAACSRGDESHSSRAMPAGPSTDGQARSVRAAAQGVRLAPVGRFEQPVYVAGAPGDAKRVFVVEQSGRIRVVRDRRTLARPFLDLSQEVSLGSERGLLSMAFAPDYQRSGKFYVYFTDRQGDIRVQELRRSRSSADRADRRTRRQLLRVEHSAFDNHNGGQLQFGPDRMLYVGLGDGGGGGDPRGNGQNLGTLPGKLLRIDPRPEGTKPYRIPAGNPFVGRSGARDEVYSYGLRNPFRFSFDRRTGDLVIGDVGQDRVEEIDFVRRGRGAGANFGWNAFEGSARFAPGTAPGHIPPVIERPHSEGNCAIIGGYVVRDRALRGLFGRYVYGDFCLGRVRSALLDARAARGDRALPLRVPELSSFGEDSRGRVYATSLSGRVYRLAPR